MKIARTVRPGDLVQKRGDTFIRCGNKHASKAEGIYREACQLTIWTAGGTWYEGIDPLPTTRTISLPRGVLVFAPYIRADK